MAATIRFQNIDYIRPEVGKDEAEALIARAKNKDDKVADEILVVLAKTIHDPKNKARIHAGMLRHFSPRQLEMLQKKVSLLKNIPNKQAISAVLNVAIFSTTNLAVRKVLSSLKNTLIESKTTALVVAEPHALSVRAEGSKEIQVYPKAEKAIVEVKEKKQKK